MDRQRARSRGPARQRSQRQLEKRGKGLCSYSNCDRCNALPPAWSVSYCLNACLDLAPATAYASLVRGRRAPCHPLVPNTLCVRIPTRNQIKPLSRTRNQHTAPGLGACICTVGLPKDCISRLT